MPDTYQEYIQYPVDYTHNIIASMFERSLCINICEGFLW